MRYDILLELYNKIKEKFKFINKDSEMLIVDDSLDNTNRLLDFNNKLSDMLEANLLFEEEYYLSLSITSYIKFIIKDENLAKKSNLFIANILINFFNLIIDKQDLLLAEKTIDYKKEYEEFNIFLNNQKEYFHTHIYKGSADEYDETIDKVTNILW